MKKMEKDNLKINEVLSAIGINAFAFLLFSIKAPGHWILTVQGVILFIACLHLALKIKFYYQPIIKDLKSGRRRR